jgi:hypothetical protein
VFPNDLAKAGQVIAQNAGVGRALARRHQSMVRFDDESSLSAVCSVHTNLDSRFSALILDHTARAFVSNKSKRRSGR